MQEYLKLPLKFNQFFQSGRIGRCSLKDSISRNLHLLITTFSGENNQDPNYGSSFWDYDYNIHISSEERRELVRSSLLQQVDSYEKRLTDVSVQVEVRQTELSSKGTQHLRYRLEIRVFGKIAISNEPYQFATAFFIGPYMLD